MSSLKWMAGALFLSAAVTGCGGGAGNSPDLVQGQSREDLFADGGHRRADGGSGGLTDGGVGGRGDGGSPSDGGWHTDGGLN